MYLYVHIFRNKKDYLNLNKIKRVNTYFIFISIIKMKCQKAEGFIILKKFEVYNFRTKPETNPDLMHSYFNMYHLCLDYSQVILIIIIDVKIQEALVLLTLVKLLSHWTREGTSGERLILRSSTVAVGPFLGWQFHMFWQVLLCRSSPEITVNQDYMIMNPTIVL